MKPLLLDLFCGEGGAGAGYARAGFQVVGVDIELQPRYPFEFYQEDALDLGDRFLRTGQFHAVHASPPCQAFSTLRHLSSNDHPDLVAATRRLLAASGLPWVIENVPGAPLLEALTLCGSEFGLSTTSQGIRRHVRRHRLFESNVFLMGAGGCSCAGKLIGGIYGTGGGGPATRGYKLNRAESAAALDIDWMSRAGLSQSIPPAYTEHIGAQLMAHVADAAA